MILVIHYLSQFLCIRNVGGAQLGGCGSMPPMMWPSWDVCDQGPLEVSFTDLSGTGLGNWNDRQLSISLSLCGLSSKVASG